MGIAGFAAYTQGSVPRFTHKERSTYSHASQITVHDRDIGEGVRVYVNVLGLPIYGCVIRESIDDKISVYWSGQVIYMHFCLTSDLYISYNLAFLTSPIARFYTCTVTTSTTYLKLWIYCRDL
jgi:hypothetical protein